MFLQGDHYQFNAKKYVADPESMTDEIRRACRLAVDAGYRNIDIDASTLVDLSLDGADAQQRANYERTGELVTLIGSLEPDGVTISIGGEIGEVGKENSTEPELRAYLDGLRRELAAAGTGGANGVGISKVSVQTGTSHGGSVMPDGSVGAVAVEEEQPVAHQRRVGLEAGARAQAVAHRVVVHLHRHADVEPGVERLPRQLRVELAQRRVERRGGGVDEHVDVFVVELEAAPQQGPPGEQGRRGSGDKDRGGPDAKQPAPQVRRFHIE